MEAKKYTIKTFGKNTKRRDYSKSLDNNLKMDLLEHQKNGFDEFINKKIEDLFKEIFPIISKKGDIKVEYKSHRIEWPSDLNKAQQIAKEKISNFSVPLYAIVELHNDRTGEVKKDEIFFVNIPVMTEGGNFIINGSERVIVSQIVRSPGVFYEDNKATVGTSGGVNAIQKIGTIIPNRGPWIELNYKDYKLLGINPSPLYLKTDKNKKPIASLLLNVCGFDNNQLLDFFDNSPLIQESIKKLKLNADSREELIDTAKRKLFSVLMPADSPTERALNDLVHNLIFNQKRYDLDLTGRYKLNRKLNIANRLKNRYLAESILDKNGKILFKDKTYMNNEKIIQLEEHINKKNVALVKLQGIDNSVYGLNLNGKPTTNRDKVMWAKVYLDPKNPSGATRNVIGNDPYTDERILTIPDLVAIFSHLFNLEDGISNYDDIDALSNRRIRTISELLINQIRIGLVRVEKLIREKISANYLKDEELKPGRIISTKIMNSTLKDFFNSSQLSQFMDQINPIAEISSKRRITALGPGGLSRDTASLVVRGIHDTHYGRICPIETPEGPNIGLILNLANFARINKYGFIETPYRKVLNGKITKDIIWLQSDEEEKYKIVESSVERTADGMIKNKFVTVRTNGGELQKINSKNVTLMDLKPKQIVSVATSCIPFLENDDANRALMGANMQRQAVPLLKTEAPIVATGSEETVANYSPSSLHSPVDGTIAFVDGKLIKIKGKDNKMYSLFLTKFERSNQTTSINQVPIVDVGESVKKGEIVADGPSVHNGELALGKNVLTAFTTYKGFNYEDAIILSERLIKDDVYTSIHIEKHTIEVRKTKLGVEEVTVNIPNAKTASKKYLDNEGIVTIGSKVSYDDILVGKVTPRTDDELSPEEKLLDAILGNKVNNVKDSSLRVPNGGDGIVSDIKIISRENGDKLDDGIEKIIKIYVTQKRKIKVGDKMSGRHGNKGVVAKILPIEDMPRLADGTPIDIMLNPLGVPSRMNIGQVLELHLGMAGRKLNTKFATPVFDGISSSELIKIMEEAKMDKSGKIQLFDGITGEPFADKVSVGMMYMLKLSHMIDDKMHSRGVGPYSLITQQPLGGKAQNGGQRFGEMEAWALEAYGASNILQEMMTYKSDDIRGRNELYNAIIKGNKFPEPRLPEAFWVLFYELRGLGLNLTFNEKPIKPTIINKGAK